jgi:hypothetical protein
MQLPTDTTNIRFTCTKNPELRTVHETGQPRIDRASNKELFQVQLMAQTGDGAEILAVTVPGQPAVSVGQPVTVEGLVALPWTQGNRAGIAYRASAIRAVGPTKPAGNTG